jgi:hypothetical protein
MCVAVLVVASGVRATSYHAGASPFALGKFWISLLKFFKNSRRQSFVNQIVRVPADYLGTVNLHTLPLPTTETKHLLIKFVGEALGPCRELLCEIGVQDGL